MKKFRFVKIGEDGGRYHFWKEFPSAYLADRWASRTLVNGKISFTVVFQAGEEL